MNTHALEEAYEQVQHCQAELENALSMGNAKRIADCKRWAAEAKAIYKQVGGESRIPKSTPLSQEKSSLLSSDRLSYCLPTEAPLTPRAKKRNAERKP